jgi:outer membrane cobalamin receptor
MCRRPLFWLSLLLLAIDVGVDHHLATQAMANEQIDYGLQPIVVTATRTPQLLWESNANVVVVTNDEIEQSTAQHLGDILMMLPGVNIGALGDIGQNVSLGIRGSSAGQVLILVDGVPVNDPQHGGLDLNLISLDNVQKIEVIRGAASSLYGSDALGGVVNVITWSTTYEKPFSNIAYQQGDHGLEKVAARFARSFHRRFDLNFTASSTNYDGYRNNSDYLGRHLAGRLRYILGNDWQVKYSTQIYQGEVGVPGMDVWPTPNARQDDRSWNQTFSLQGSPSQEQRVLLNLYRHFSRQDYDNPDWFSKARHRRWIHGVELQHSFSLCKGHRVTMGSELQNRRLDSTENGRHDMNRGAVFAQDEICLHQNIRLRLAGRYDYNENFEDQFSPDLTLTWLTGAHASFFTSLRRSYRAPTFNDLYWPEVEYDYDLNGQPDYRESGNVQIKPEKANSFQIGARAKRGEVAADICIFHREVMDLIQWDNTDESYLYGNWMPVNKSEATIRGLECQAIIGIRDRLEASLAYTYLDAKDVSLDRRLPYQPGQQLAGHLQYGLILFGENSELVSRLEAQYLGERYVDAAEGEKLPALVMINGKISLRAMGLRLYFVAKNMTDKRYCFRAGYPMPGRTFVGGVSWEFWD